MHISNRDPGSGAEKIAHDLFQAMRKNGHSFWLTVVIKNEHRPYWYQEILER